MVCYHHPYGMEWYYMVLCAISTGMEKRESVLCAGALVPGGAWRRRSGPWGREGWV